MLGTSGSPWYGPVSGSTVFLEKTCLGGVLDSIEHVMYRKPVLSRGFGELDAELPYHEITVRQ